jgi:hypothetical protein
MNRDVLRWALFLLIGAASCRFDPAYRDTPEQPACTLGATRCEGDKLTTCTGDALVQKWQATDDCRALGLLCSGRLSACATCDPGTLDCRGTTPVACDDTGQWQPLAPCDPSRGYACRGGQCAQLCDLASAQQSNVGCEYWGADLDNAVIDPTNNAAEQQYAIVVSNVQDDVSATVSVEQDDSAASGTTSDTRVIATATITPHNLEVFKLGPREVDGSADGTFNTGTGTALTRHAYRVKSSFPIVAFQFNPLENVDVFSNDASQLLPVSGLNGGVGRAYVVPGWPQTLAVTSDPATNWNLNLRAFLTIVGTRPDTHVTLTSAARVIPGGPFASGLDRGASAQVVLQPFDVLNLETGDSNADFTGSLIDADQPIAVFPGSECSDSPPWMTKAERFCCCDHLEHQTPPVRTVGKSYVLAKMPNRTSAIIAAGGRLGEVDEIEYYRVVAVQAGTTHVTTTLPAPWDAFDLNGEGDSKTVPSKTDFLLDASPPATVLEVQGSQESAGVPIAQGLPGGDPSTTVPPPREQWRSDYVMLTPDKYVFDYLVVVAPSDAHAFVDGIALDATNAEVTPSDGLTAMERGSATPPYLTYRYQLSYPIIDPTIPPPAGIMPGKQNDGVHHVQADAPVMVIAYGFDYRVSYAYTGGTQLAVINAQ